MKKPIRIFSKSIPLNSLKYRRDGTSLKGYLFRYKFPLEGLNPMEEQALHDRDPDSYTMNSVGFRPASSGGLWVKGSFPNV
jgi:hypothetical protein